MVNNDKNGSNSAIDGFIKSKKKAPTSSSLFSDLFSFCFVIDKGILFRAFWIFYMYLLPYIYIGIYKKQLVIATLYWHVFTVTFLILNGRWLTCGLQVAVLAKSNKVGLEVNQEIKVKTSIMVCITIRHFVFTYVLFLAPFKLDSLRCFANTNVSSLVQYKV